jgi:hypothetical protein
VAGVEGEEGHVVKIGVLWSGRDGTGDLHNDQFSDELDLGSEEVAGATVSGLGPDLPWAA